MKKYFFFLMILLSGFDLLAQDVRFYFTVTNPTGLAATIKVYAESVGPANTLRSFDAEFYYDNTKATLSSVNHTPLSVGLNWGVQSASILFTPGINPLVPITHTGKFSSAFFDGTIPFTGSVIPAAPGVLLYELNFTGVMLPTDGFLGATAQSGVLYSDTSLDEYDIFVTGAQAQPLPIELTALTAKANEKDINVIWASENEFNFSHFDLERSTDGSNFEFIANIVGKGSARNNYTYTDEKVKSGITYYYRLKMNDRDGKYKYSKIVQATLNGGSFNLVSVSPNPTFSNINILFDTKDESNINLRVFDLNGRLMEVQNFTSVKGNNFYTMDLSAYPAGMYWLSINDGHNQVQHKIIKTEQ